MSQAEATLVEARKTAMPLRAACPHTVSVRRLLILAALLIVEIVCLTLCFDAQRLSDETGWGAWLLAQSPRFLRAAIAMTTAVLLLGGTGSWHSCRRLAAERRPSARWPLFLLAHFVLFAGFACLTWWLFEGDCDLRGYGGWWAVLWWTLGAAALGCLVAATVPPTLWAPVARRSAGPLLGGLAVGALAFGFGLVTSGLWLRLSQATFWTVKAILSVFTSDLVCDPGALVIGSSTFNVEIAAPCSGYEGIGLLLVFLGAYVCLFRAHLRLPHVLLLFPVGVLLIWLVNAIRIAVLIGIGTAGWPQVALGGFHSQAGWLAFNGLALGFVTLTTRSRFFRNGAADLAAEPSTNATIAYLGPWLAILTVAMITRVFAIEFDWLYPLRVLGALGVLWACRRIYAPLRSSISWQAPVLGALTFVLWLLLVPRENLAASAWPAPLADANRAWSTAWLIFRLLGFVAIVPLAEELAFRGYLTRRLVQRDFQALALGQMTWLSFVVSSVLFGLMHQRNWLAGTIAGMLFALALKCRGRLADAVVAHATANGLLACYALATGRWFLWG